MSPCYRNSIPDPVPAWARASGTPRGAGCLLLALAAALFACGRTPPVREIAPARRHVLLVTVDTLRFDYLSANGYDRPTSPFIDSLSARGYTFTRAVTPIARTTAALASLLTGAYPHTTGVRNLVDSLAPNVVTLAQLARQRGYATVAVVSNHILAPERDLRRGFDVYDFADAARRTSPAVLCDTKFGSA